MLYLFQKGFHYAEDGPGNRLIYHLQGCQLRCPWCANPEGLAFAGGEGYAVKDLVDEVLRSRPMFFDGGGLTLTGGEVTVQADAALSLLRAVKEAGISTCIETNGISERLPEFFPFVDHLIMDIKHHDHRIHASVTGASNERAIENLSRAMEAGKFVHVRIPLIGTFNAKREDALAFSALFARLGLAQRGDIELLLYHEYGRAKYEKLGMPYLMGEEARVTEDTRRVFSEILAENGFSVVRT